jgi:hypothetical protein
MRPPARRVGLEQEFFLVDASGKISDLGDRLLKACQKSARDEGIDPRCFKAECVHSLVEVTTPPSAGFSHLAENYVSNLGLALDVAAGLGLGLYPLGIYPLPTRSTVCDEPRYSLKARTIGNQRFLHAVRHPALRCGGEAGRGHQLVACSTANGATYAALAQRHGSGPSREPKAHRSDGPLPLIVLPTRDVQAQRLGKGES